ncbi:MAG: hypothetical protein NXH97_21045 [Rhodobacteraceae bacterium]|nr:hypothetical protein [Paracoccaceae bacterium]
MGAAMAFEEFVRKELGATTFATSLDDPKTQLFHLSRQSFEDLSAWTKDARNAAGEPVALLSGYVDVMRPNAFADRWQGHQIVAMNSSLFAAASEFALFCFTQPSFFPDIGDPSKETGPSPIDDRVPGIWLLDYTAGGGHVGDAHSDQVIPKDTDRYFAGLWLGQLMARFVWLHELAHAVNGHVNYAGRNGLSTRLYELPMDAIETSGPQPMPLDPETSKCLEFDADQSAFYGSLNIQKHDIENIESIAAFDRPTRTQLALFAAYAMIWLIEQFEGWYSANARDSHPEPSLRLQNLFRTLATTADELGAEIVTHNSMVIDAFDAVQAAIPKLYVARDLRARIQDAELMDALKAYDPRLDVLKAELKTDQFSARP